MVIWIVALKLKLTMTADMVINHHRYNEMGTKYWNSYCSF